MYKIRARFQRGEQVKYISHLDLVRAFERAFRRSGLPISYSQGFNPRAEMVFGLPLAVGVTSEAEYADFKFDKHIASEDFISIINRHLPGGIKVMEAWDLKDKGNIMSAVSASVYEITFVILQGENGNKIIENIHSLKDEDELLVDKKTKKGNVEVNIKPLIKELKAEYLYGNEWDGIKDGNNIDGQNVHRYIKMTAHVSAGSKNNLKPDLLMEAIKKYLNVKIEILRTHRIELFIK